MLVIKYFWGIFAQCALGVLNTLGFDQALCLRPLLQFCEHSENQNTFLLGILVSLLSWYNCY